ncbi:MULTISPECIES: hypothetical protein [Rhizobium/Agrobacterium group]|uniref:hypothetical protein n=1 Tax=Rhizobium/Agrobacterium group TaxID=227290 RepID=UPI00048ACC2A|nr:MULTISPECIES: hypothetical protein [Rhizobium/Agrobacterium group]KAA9382617.1 hypothetical protein F4V88_28970 [Neorhizobium galegae]KAB1110745.1 hypothetical protein F4V89_22995 [Neorhizobium galegae]MCM2500928.1 hypothetical protein [Neorhizobium galegae]MCQ1775303.1 hypothetical protein [Neorhizobium galegae]MCQ1799283.1 hypothetical protein [Neorhizobium galegae]
MVDRMSERAKDDLDRIVQQLYAIAPEVDKLATDCANALQSNVDADGDYISKRTMRAFSDIREAIAHLYAAGHTVMDERDRFFGRSMIRR